MTGWSFPCTAQLRSAPVRAEVQRSWRRLRGALAYDQQALLAKILRLDTEIIMLKTERAHW